MAPSSLLFVLLAAAVASVHGGARFRQIYRHVLSHNNGVSASGKFKCTSAGFFNHESDCKRFYRCVDFWGTVKYFYLFEFLCASGTYFDPSLSVCNYPERIKPTPACLSAAIAPSLNTSPTPSSSFIVTDTAVTQSVAEVSSTISSVDGSTESSSSLTEMTSESTTTAEPAVSSVSIGSSSEVSPISTPEVVSSSPAIEPDPSPSPPAETTQEVQSSSTQQPPDESSGQTSVSSTTVTEALPTEEPSSQPPQQPHESSSTASSISVTETTLPVSSSPEQSSEVSPIVSPSTAPPSVPFTLSCGDRLFHRHPLQCNLYYQCVWNGMAFDIEVFHCPVKQVYDESSASCQPQDPSKPCISPTSSTACSTAATTETNVFSTTVLSTDSSTASTASSTASTASSTLPQYTLAPGSLYKCTLPGHFPYELDCIRFYRCFEVQPGVLKGLLYRCPEGYGYSRKTERCEKQNTLPPCDRSTIQVWDYPIPMIPLEDTTVVRVEDFDEFFGNPNYFYRPRL